MAGSISVPALGAEDGFMVLAAFFTAEEEDSAAVVEVSTVAVWVVVGFMAVAVAAVAIDNSPSIFADVNLE